MAGIGLELRRILKRETFAAWASAYLFGAVIVLGPFLCSVLSLAGITVLGRGAVSDETQRVFTGAAVTVFGASLVLTGAVQVVLTRYLADLVYRGAYDDLIASLFPALLLSSACLSLAALPYLWISPLALAIKVVLWSLLMTVGALWILVVYVTAAQGHRAVVAVFLAGSATAFGGALALGRGHGLIGLLSGYTLGQFVILGLLLRHLIVEFGYPARWDWRLLRYFRQFPSLIVIGLLHNLGIWIDKFVFWASPLSLSAGGFVTAPKYDSATFIGFLTCLPAMTHFFVRIEADFSQHFHEYFDEIFFRHSYERISAAATTLRGGVISALLDIFKVQGVISFLCAVYAVPLLRASGLPLSEVGTLRFAITGSLFLSFMLFSNVILLYLDRRREVLIASVVFTGANLFLSVSSLHAGYSFYGAGFATACLLGMLCSLTFLTDQLFNLEYRTFSSIPVIGRRSGRGLRARPGGLFGRYNPIKRDSPQDGP
jgi:uncharacterized membrane protein